MGLVEGLVLLQSIQIPPRRSVDGWDLVQNQFQDFTDKKTLWERDQKVDRKGKKWSVGSLEQQQGQRVVTNSHTGNPSVSRVMFRDEEMKDRDTRTRSVN